MTRKWFAIVTTALLASSAATVLSAQGREGITVHGNWVIVVRNPDGTLASRTEFENALIPSSGGAGGGAHALSSLLGGVQAVTHWRVALGTLGATGGSFYVATNSAFATSDGNRVAHIVAAGDPEIGSPPSVTLLVAPGLVRSRAGNPGPFGESYQNKLLLTGSIRATGAGTINGVGTQVALSACPPNERCASNPMWFTGKDLGADSVTVSAGQLIEVTVTFSFS